MNFVEQLEEAKKGDLKSIEQVCSATWEPLYRFIYLKVQNREEAEDITQETYVKTLTYLQKHKTQPDNFFSFMKTVALNLVRDRWRQKKRRGTAVNIAEIYTEKTAVMDSQDEIALRLQLEKALAELNSNQRTVLELRIIKGYSVAETAKMTGKTEGAVRTAQYRALQALARILDSYEQ